MDGFGIKKKITWLATELFITLVLPNTFSVKVFEGNFSFNSVFQVKESFPFSQMAALRLLLLFTKPHVELIRTFSVYTSNVCKCCFSLRTIFGLSV